MVALLLLFKGIFLLFSIMKLYLFLTIFYKNGVGPAVLRLPPPPFRVSCCGCRGSQVTQMYPSQATAYELLLGKGPSAHHSQLCSPT